jgi:hypothetical protein
MDMGALDDEILREQRELESLQYQSALEMLKAADAEAGYVIDSPAFSSWFTLFENPLYRVIHWSDSNDHKRTLVSADRPRHESVRIPRAMHSVDNVFPP